MVHTTWGSVSGTFGNVSSVGVDSVCVCMCVCVCAPNAAPQPFHERRETVCDHTVSVVVAAFVRVADGRLRYVKIFISAWRSRTGGATRRGLSSAQISAGPEPQIAVGASKFSTQDFSVPEVAYLPYRSKNGFQQDG